MTEDLFSYAHSRRDLGIKRSVEHADIVQIGWSDAAMICLLAYARLCGRPFMIEEVRDAATDLPPPPDGRAWGAVVQRAARAGTVVQVGFQRAKSSNLSPKCLWRAA